MSDGKSTADLITEILECDCSVDDAIEIEQRLFSRLTAENARLRAALERIAYQHGSPNEHIDYLAGIAREALGGEE